MAAKFFWFSTTAATLIAAASLAGAPAAGPVRFQAHDIAVDFKGAYAVDVADFNKDGKLDVIANSLAIGELAWYENPTWERHLITAEAQQIVNQAAHDLDGDGIPEVAFESSFAMQPAKSEGKVWIARHQGDPKKPWKVEPMDAFPTSHHILWADLDGDGKKELLNAPLVGAKSAAPTYDQDVTPVFWYSAKDWKRHTMTDSIPGIIHRIRAVSWEGNRRQQVLVASFEGVVMYKTAGTGDGLRFEKTVLSNGHVEKAPRLGASDVATGAQDGKRFFASVEPWHGNEVVVYTEKGGKWDRRVIFDQIASGHEVAVIDLNGDGRDDVVANDNARDKGGVHVFYAPNDAAAGEWTYHRVEDQKGMNSCVGADINGDKRNDLVCAGSGAAIRWYENLGK